VEVLVLDEVSMLSAELLTVLDYMARKLRCSKQPFGGIQLILCGDFLQLPPVPPRLKTVHNAAEAGSEEEEEEEGSYDDEQSLPHYNPDLPTEALEAVAASLELVRQKKWIYAFKAPVWDELGLECVELTAVMRQTERRFISILHEIRLGGLCEESARELMAASGPDLKGRAAVELTRLFATNHDVDRINQESLGALEGESSSFEAVDAGDDMGQLERLYGARSCLDLKIGAQVMLTRNVGELFNGCRGVVVGYLRVEEVFGRSGAEQQDSLNKLLPNRYLYGGWFSRQNSEWCAENELLPVVDFLARGPCCILPIEFKVLDSKGLQLASRIQLPLQLAYAQTVHRTQGASIDALEVNLPKAYCPGQAYVALSRATSLGSMCVKGFGPSVVYADEDALAFYAKIHRGKKP